jgi:hypothetical protein
MDLGLLSCFGLLGYTIMIDDSSPQDYPKVPCLS